MSTVWADVVAAYQSMTEDTTRWVDEIRMSERTVKWLIAKLDVPPVPDNQPRPLDYVPPPATLMGIRVIEDEAFAPGQWEARDRRGAAIKSGSFF